jgi:hypothetical protein
MMRSPYIVRSRLRESVKNTFLGNASKKENEGAP